MNDCGKLPQAVEAYRVPWKLVLSSYGSILGLLLTIIWSLFNVSGSFTRRQNLRLEDRGLLQQLRNVIAETGQAAGDFVVKNQEDGFHAYENSLSHARGTAETLLASLKRQSTSIPTDEIRRLLNQYWASLDDLRLWDSTKRANEGYKFLAQTLPQARRPVQLLIRDLLESDVVAYKRESPLFYRWLTATLLLLSISLFLLLSAVGLAIRYASSLKRANNFEVQAAKEAKADLQRLSARLLNVQENERRAISRELHDGVGQILTAAFMEISHIRAKQNPASVKADAPLNRVETLVQEAISTTRDVCLLLRPAILDDLGLAPALAWQADTFTRRTGVSCYCFVPSFPERLPEAWNVCIYRVVQEALHNVEKHSGATRIDITVSNEQESLIIKVSDDGRGFDATVASNRPGLGIIGMRERASMLGGRIEVTSAPGRGTTVMLQLPQPPGQLGREQPSSLAEYHADHADSHSYSR